MFKTSVLRSDLCDYSDTYTVVKGRIIVEGDNDDRTSHKRPILKNNLPLRSCISKINNTFISNVEDLDIVMSMYNLFEYSDSTVILLHQEVCGIIIIMKQMMIEIRIMII